MVMISSRREGASNVAAEALLLGLPVVTTDCGGHCEAVRQSSGRVVAVGNSQELGTAAADLLADPPDRTQVRKAAAELLSVDRMVTAHLDVYRQLLARD
jgi:colanic acid/amylovoran biosynthesis glycosyltransferase